MSTPWQAESSLAVPMVSNHGSCIKKRLVCSSLFSNEGVCGSIPLRAQWGVLINFHGRCQFLVSRFYYLFVSYLRILFRKGLHLREARPFCRISLLTFVLGWLCPFCVVWVVLVSSWASYFLAVVSWFCTA